MSHPSSAIKNTLAEKLELSSLLKNLLVLLLFVVGSLAFILTSQVLSSQKRNSVFFVPVSEIPSLHVEVILPYPAHQGPLAHYTEHLAWLNAVGGAARAADRHTNAWTNAYAVGYWLTGRPDDLPDLLATLAGVFDPLDLSPSFAAEERNIILREYDYRMSVNTDAQAADALDAFLYQGNGLAASIIGTPEQIMALDYDAAREFHAATHRPELATVVVKGDVTEREVRRAMRAAGWPDARVPHWTNRYRCAISHLRDAASVGAITVAR